MGSLGISSNVNISSITVALVNHHGTTEEARIQLEEAKNKDTIHETRIQLEDVVNPHTNDETRIQVEGAMLEDTPLHRKGASSLKTKLLSSLKLQNYEIMKRKIIDPEGQTMHIWHNIFLVACLVSLFVDPLFLFLPSIRGDVMCIQTGGLKGKLILTVIRSVADVFYMVQIYVRFHTAYAAPSSSTYAFGRCTLVVDPVEISARYLKTGFFLDLIVALPLPQVMIWGVIPSLSGSMMRMKHVLWFILISQYIPKLFLIFPISFQIVKAAGLVTKTAWAAAAYNLLLSILASHVLGALWFLLAIQRQEGCWQYACTLEGQTCQDSFFDCITVDDAARGNWYKSSNISTTCDPGNSDYPFGMYGEALTSKVSSSPFFNRYCYSLWWGLKNLSSLGQGLLTSTSIGEILFAIMIAILGIVLFALLIGNMQRYLQSTTMRLEEWRIRRTDTEKWMRNRQLPVALRESVRKYEQYKWVATKGVDEETLLKGLPAALRRHIKRHLCFDLVRRVPLISKMDEMTVEAMCERLQPALYTEGTYLTRQGDPVNEMHFIIRGYLESYTISGGQNGFFHSCQIGVGDFCGEGLLTWALNPNSSVVLPSSPRTVKATSEVEAFTLRAEDLKFVTAQFKMLHSTRLQHTFRFYSHQWRTRAACFIQTAWRRYKKQRNACGP